MRIVVASTTVAPRLPRQTEEKAGEVALVAGVEMDGRLVEHQQLRLLSRAPRRCTTACCSPPTARPPAGAAAPRLPTRRRASSTAAKSSAFGAHWKADRWVAPEQNHLLDARSAPATAGSAARRRCAGRSRAARGPRYGRSLQAISACRGRSSPVSSRSRVVLPAPLGPTTTRHSPDRTSRSSGPRMVRSPLSQVRPRAVTRGALNGSSGASAARSSR